MLLLFLRRTMLLLLLLMSQLVWFQCVDDVCLFEESVFLEEGLKVL